MVFVAVHVGWFSLFGFTFFTISIYLISGAGFHSLKKRPKYLQICTRACEEVRGTSD